MLRVFVVSIQSNIHMIQVARNTTDSPSVLYMFGFAYWIPYFFHHVCGNICVRNFLYRMYTKAVLKCIGCLLGSRQLTKNVRCSSPVDIINFRITTLESFLCSTGFLEGSWRERFLNAIGTWYHLVKVCQCNVLQASQLREHQDTGSVDRVDFSQMTGTRSGYLRRSQELRNPLWKLEKRFCRCLVTANSYDFLWNLKDSSCCFL